MGSGNIWGTWRIRRINYRFLLIFFRTSDLLREKRINHLSGVTSCILALIHFSYVCIYIHVLLLLCLSLYTIPLVFFYDMFFKKADTSLEECLTEEDIFNTLCWETKLPTLSLPDHRESRFSSLSMKRTPHLIAIYIQSVVYKYKHYIYTIYTYGKASNDGESTWRGTTSPGCPSVW